MHFILSWKNDGACHEEQYNSISPRTRTCGGISFLLTPGIPSSCLSASFMTQSVNVRKEPVSRPRTLDGSHGGFRIESPRKLPPGSLVLFESDDAPALSKAGNAEVRCCRPAKKSGCFEFGISFPAFVPPGKISPCSPAGPGIFLSRDRNLIPGHYFSRVVAFLPGMHRSSLHSKRQELAITPFVQGPVQENFVTALADS